MNLQQAYDFYIETYKGTHPAMLDVAPTFERFGAKGKDYIANKALNTTDTEEFEADLTALLILDNKCTGDLASRLGMKANRFGTRDKLVAEACGSGATGVPGQHSK